MQTWKTSTAMDGTVLRKDLENQTFAELKADPTNEKLRLYLHQLIENHVQTVMYAVLRKNDRALLNEATDKVMMNLEKFQGQSLFTTWVHRIVMNVMYDERRLERKRKEVSLDVPGFDIASDVSPETIDLLMSIRQVLDDSEYALFDQMAVQGMTQEEVAQEMDCSQAWVHYQYTKVLGKLQDAFRK